MKVLSRNKEENKCPGRGGKCYVIMYFNHGENAASTVSICGRS